MRHPRQALSWRALAPALGVVGSFAAMLESTIDRMLMPTPLRLLLALVIAGASCITAAAAQTATTTTSVNVRAGPEKNFPTVTWLLSGTTVTVVGCVANWRWCDVIAGRDRGWVYSRFLSIPFNGTAVTILNGGPNLGLPQSEFSLGEYWDAHYQRQHWFGRKAHWQQRWDRRPPPREWRDPSPGTR
ncbi:SH3 domain-containing protein [Accumulibacter sp.]|uniref:SH3 domain-containing protein n=1 Tax=Accumulibacter sp. TaxID=2053492 RepID=UPI0026003FF0|nr:SH3 domain-containing protein [Accumulibacter sp.]MCM8594773.1 SH3 domain-containing protein [Accumulibacter sp.]MDS4048918.1 SH3 domain-containing protein [Accumulibacter sp.]